MAVEIECVTEVSDELAEAFARLMPQLSPRLGALSRQAMERVVCSDGAALFAARLDGRIAGVLTLVWYDVPSGRKAWVEDVVVDAAARGCGAGEALVKAATEHAARIGAVKVVIVSLAASLHEQRDLAVGTALGSNIINILLILGLAALVRPFTVHSDVLRRELPLMLLVSVVAGSVLYDGQLSRSDGIFLLFLAVLWLLFIVKLARQAERQGTDSLTREQLAELPRDGGLPVAFLWLGIALIIMPVATRMVVDNATVLANYFAISELTMGLTAIAIGTSLPELATAIAGVRKGENDIAVGNIIGANIFNIVIVLGLPALITPGEIDPLAYSRDYSVMLLVSIIFALLCWRRSPQSGRGVGVLLTGGFIVWLAMLYWLSPILVE